MQASPQVADAVQSTRTPVHVLAERLREKAIAMSRVDDMASGSYDALQEREHRLMKVMLKATDVYRDMLGLASQLSSVTGQCSRLNDMIDMLDGGIHDCSLNERAWSDMIEEIGADCREGSYCK